MSKTTKSRHCPAVDRQLSATECGENRVSRYACPSDCPHNSFAPGNYSQFLTLEAKVDRKCLTRVKEWVPDREAFEAEMDRAAFQSNSHAAHMLVSWNLLFATDSEGLTCVQRRERSGFPGLRNDERVLLRAKLRTRMALLEVHRVLDAERIEAVDLFEAAPTPMIFQDRSLAAVAVRFTVLVCWIYPLPHYWRLSGMAIQVPELALFEPREVVVEIVRHLGVRPMSRGCVAGWRNTRYN